MQQRSQFQTLGCKNHPEDQASYHLLDQPWVKLCSHCALNIAVSGRKIGKQLSGEQLQNKIILTAITSEMRCTMELVEQANKRMSEQVQKAERISSQQIGKQIKKFDEFVGNLMKVRDGLWQMYEEMVVKKINGEVQKQSRLILNEMELKKTIDKIQTHFSDFVEGKVSSIPLKQQIEEWKNLNKETKDLASPKAILEDFTELKGKFYNQIYKSSQAISSYSYPQPEDKENHETIMTEENSINMSKTCTKIAQLKLRSKSKNFNKKYTQQMDYSKKRKSIQDISNMAYRIGNFQI